jgi:hypothetical protein
MSGINRKRYWNENVYPSPVTVWPYCTVHKHVLTGSLERETQTKYFGQDTKSIKEKALHY